MKRLLLRIATPVICIFGRILFGLAHLVRRPRKPEKLGKVLVIKLWAIGEVVMTTPVLEALKRHDPECEVHMLVGRTSLPVVEHSPYCDKVIPVDESIFLRPKLGGLLRLAGDLSRGRYDTAVVLHHFFVFGLFAWWVGIPVRAGLDRCGEGFALTHKASRPEKPTHRVDEYLSALGALGLGTGGLSPSVELLLRSAAAAEEALENAFADHNGLLVVLLPTGGSNIAATIVDSNIVAKRWPADYYLELAARLAEKGCRVLVLGGPEEEPLRAEFESGAPPGVEIQIMRNGLRTDMALIRQADAVVTNDSGPMHIAAALGARVIAIFGPTDPRVFGPYSPGSTILCAHEDCCPCFDESVFPNRMADCDHNRCMHNVSVEMVLEAVEDILGERHDG